MRHATTTPRAESPAGSGGSASQVLTALARHSRERPDAPAIEAVDRDGPGPGRVTFAELHDAVNRAAASIDRLTRPGDTIVVFLANGPDYVVAFLAAIRAARVVFPVPLGAGPLEAARAITAARASLLIASEPMADAAGARTLTLRDLPTFDASSVPDSAQQAWSGVLLHSSGSTGMPRIVRRSRRSLDAVAASVATATRLGPSDRVLAAVPMAHSYGMESCLLAPLWAGATILSLPSLESGSLERAMGRGATVLPGVPFFYETLTATARPSDLRLRLAYSAGAPLPRAVGDAFERAWGARVGQLYGATELGSITLEDPGAPDFDPERAGTPLHGAEIVVSDPHKPAVVAPLPPETEGHVLVRSPSMLDGYLGEPAPLLDGFFPTGDLGRLDSSGRLTLTGRLKLMIDVGGAKVNPLEVERVLRQCPGVGECVVVPIAASPTVSRLRAIVVPDPTGPAPDEASLRAFARERLAPYKVPRVFETRAALPKSPTGKVLRNRIEGEP